MPVTSRTPIHLDTPGEVAEHVVARLDLLNCAPAALGEAAHLSSRFQELLPGLGGEQIEPAASLSGHDQ